MLLSLLQNEVMLLCVLAAACLITMLTIGYNFIPLGGGISCMVQLLREMFSSKMKNAQVDGEQREIQR